MPVVRRTLIALLVGCLASAGHAGGDQAPGGGEPIVPVVSPGQAEITQSYRITASDAQRLAAANVNVADVEAVQLDASGALQSVTMRTGQVQSISTTPTVVERQNAAAAAAATTAADLMSGSLTPGADVVSLTTFESYNLDPVTSHLATAQINAPSLNLQSAYEIAQKGDSAFTPIATTTEGGVTVQDSHPIVVLSGKALAWLTPILILLSLFSGAMTVLAFMRTHDMATFMLRAWHWGLLAGIFAFMSFLVW